MLAQAGEQPLGNEFRLEMGPIVQQCHVPHFRRALRAAAQQTLVAANLLKLGAQTLDAEIITEADDALSKAVDLKFDAAALLFDLEQTTGFSCF